jgi:hypothetical protein
VGGNSDGTGDTFTSSTDDGACSVKGTLTKGHVEYEISR